MGHPTNTGSISKGCEKAKAHVVMVPAPAQGHVIPAMRLAHRLQADYGLKITLFTTDSIGSRLAKESQNDNIIIASFPDGLTTEEEKQDLMKMVESYAKLMPNYLAEFINKVVNTGEKIACIVSDNVWGLETATKMGIKTAFEFPFLPAFIAMGLQCSEILEAGIVDDEGTPIKKAELLLSPYLPAMTDSEYLWNTPGNKLLSKILFKFALVSKKCCKESNWVLGNWFHDLDPSGDDLLPNLFPIGPVLSTRDRSIGSFWSQDLSSLSWLDKQAPKSVIYIAFGSTTICSQHQFEELAFGLELIRRPFLFVVRSDFTNEVTDEHLDGFKKRTANLGKVVQWAPQEKVLAHPSVACFLTHCGYNSILESISHGIPMLCWPYFADQFYIKSCICNGWKIGLELKPDENGIVTKHQLKMKVDQLLSNHGIRSNALKLKRLAQKSLSKEGSSSKFLEEFVAQLIKS